jgi:hypothetical protein
MTKEEIKAKRLAKKLAKAAANAATPASPELAERMSIFGQKFSGSEDCQWTMYEGLGWVHDAEQWAFAQQYRKCSVRGTWFKIKPQSQVPTTEGGEPLCYEEAKENWTKDGFTNRYFKNGCGVEVRDGDGDPIVVSEFTKDNQFRKCDYSGHYYPRANVFIIVSENYKHVAVHNFTKANGFQSCPNCSTKVECKVVEYRDESEMEMCPRCYDEYLNSNNILPHDAHKYPSPIYSKQYRMGSYIDLDGMICATNKKTEVLDVRQWGVEVETEMSMSICKKNKWTRHILANAAKKALGKDFIITKEDGTLTMNGKYSDSEGSGPYYAGFEIVSCPADMATHKARWPRLAEMMGYHALRSWDTETCGFHVHVGKKTITTLQLGRMLNFINHENNKAFIQKVAGRSERKFTRYYDKKLSDALHPERVCAPEEETERNRRRRVALNVSNSHTIEWRIFRGTVNPKHILRNLEFCESMVEFCYPSARSIKEFSDHRYFIDFIDKRRKRWPLLAGWMAHWGMIATQKLGEKADRELVTLKPEVDEVEDKTDGMYDFDTHGQSAPKMKKKLMEISAASLPPSFWTDPHGAVATVKPPTDEEEIINPFADEDDDFLG